MGAFEHRRDDPRDHSYSFESYDIPLARQSGITASNATIEDFQRAAFCGEFTEERRCGAPPCTCTSPPCDACYCDALDALVNYDCASHVQWSFDHRTDDPRGHSYTFETYDIPLLRQSGVIALNATIGDFQKAAFCGEFREDRQCVAPPCSCTNPPCDVCADLPEIDLCLMVNDDCREH